MGEERLEAGGVTRLSFIKASAGVASGAALVGAPAVLLSGESQSIETAPTGPLPSEPVMAYVHDAQRGEVTVMAGTRERTYRDPALVKRLLAAAPAQESIAAGGGGLGVIAP